MLEIALEDIRRGTLSVNSGNEGWIGVSPDGTQYHLVVPVDAQIARGVMAGNRPSDGTPFGGYTGWLYFRCAPYGSGSDEETEREEQVRRNAANLLAWLANHGIVCRISHHHVTPLSVGYDQDSRLFALTEEPVATCEGCDAIFSRIGDVLRDASLVIRGYRACPDDFERGVFLFSHGCKGEVSVGVRRFARPAYQGRSLIGTHACPGFCYYESSLLPCFARCEGARYRRLVWKIASRTTKRKVR